MAKQLSGAPMHDAASSSRYPRRPPEPSYRPRHRSHRPSKPSSSPSSGLLSLLATIASATTVYGSPAPPPFLCPSLNTADNVGHPQPKDFPPPPTPPSGASSPSAAASSSEPTRKHRSRYLPDKYERGSDGVWRRVDSYTLYGSTMPSNCDSVDCRQPTTSVSSVNDQIQVGGTANATSSADSSATSAYDIRDKLPPGWTPTANRMERTTLILSLSLGLALLICFFIIGCLFWRRNSKKHKYYDVEKKAKKRRHKHELTEEEIKEIETEKEIKSKQKAWARATARWRNNARFSARQRRGMRFSTRNTQAQQSTLSVDSSRSRLAGVGSPTTSRHSSRHSSRRSSMDSLPDEEPSQEPQRTAASTSQEQLSTPEVENNTPSLAAPSSPPAYQHRGQIPPITISSADSSSDGVSGDSTPFHSGRSRRPSHSSISGPSTNTALTQSVELFPPAPVHAAHVATDDKALLARLADLASAPPADDAPDFEESSDAGVSAPAWQDEDIEEFRPAVSLPPESKAEISSTSRHSDLFPPPPSKERLAAAERLEYSFAFDGLDGAYPEPEPSAPPFEAGSAPPLDDDTLAMPSAPPLLDEEHGTDVLSGDVHEQPEPNVPPELLDFPEGCNADHSSEDLTDVSPPPGPLSSLPRHASSTASTRQAPVSAVAAGRGSGDQSRPLSTASVNTLPGYQP